MTHLVSTVDFHSLDKETTHVAGGIREAVTLARTLLYCWSFKPRELLGLYFLKKKKRLSSTVM